jgi:hypothetical protein
MIVLEHDTPYQRMSACPGETWHILSHLQHPEGRPRLNLDQKMLVHWVRRVVHPLVVVNHTQQVVITGQPCGCM